MVCKKRHGGVSGAVRSEGMYLGSSYVILTHLGKGTVSGRQEVCLTFSPTIQ